MPSFGNKIEVWTLERWKFDDAEVNFVRRFRRNCQTEDFRGVIKCP